MEADDSQPIYLRPTRVADVPAVYELIQPLVHANHLLPRTREELAGLTQHGFAAVLGNRVVGFAAVEVYSKKMAEVQCLAVSAEVRGRGIGRQLVQRCVERARELKIIELMAITASESLFRDCGFDFSLPDQKKAMFVRTHDPGGHASDELRD